MIDAQAASGMNDLFLNGKTCLFPLQKKRARLCLPTIARPGEQRGTSATSWVDGRNAERSSDQLAGQLPVHAR
jgi:hypothetical protein